ncbi:leucyl aminopeptidase family protein [Methylobrevis albus]|uniref:Leucyl aminopeptidase family protein n=1 Tax=Methylobrevis albus TaxID=2793297 RepID=A0A931I3X7_9HYPH|nr:leucyl aminopeptidase family protein [Methylobrevis albus]MBH0238446.1 leucyl aminopeptidase family protein [Methylobrevis albus]
MLTIFAAADTTEAAVPIHAVHDDGLEATLAALGGGADAWAAASGFKAEAGALLLVPGADGSLRAVLFGLGRADDPARAPLLFGRLATLPKALYRLATFAGDLPLALLGFALGSYRFSRYLKTREDGPRLVMPAGVDAREIDALARAVYLVRDLVNTPANDLGPEEIAAAVRALADRHGADYDEIVGDDLLSRGFPLVHAVGAASTRAPRLATFTWGDEADPKITLVGKGVAFDTGGLNIKPDNSMLLMKKDMGGAANVLGLAQLIMEAGLRVRLRVVVPAVENSIAGNAFRPGDVFTSRKGLTVEIGNTDAEGRLILADALAFADDEAPALIVDMATLTGAARVALGPDLPPVYTHDDKLAGDLAAAGLAVGDPVWRMPLWPPYDKLLASKIADVNHISSGGFAGSITAALFLARFVGKATAWLHADVFAWVPADKPGQPVGGEAQVIRALYEVLKARYPR